MGTKKQRRQLEEKIAQFYRERKSEYVGDDIMYVLLMVETTPRDGNESHDAAFHYSGNYEAVLAILKSAVAVMESNPESWGEELNLRPEKHN